MLGGENRGKKEQMKECRVMGDIIFIYFAVLCVSA